MRQAYIVTNGCGEELQVIGVFRDIGEAYNAQIETPSVHCYGSEIVTVQMDDEEFAVLQFLITGVRGDSE